jgi:hypothetical protein
MVRRTTRTYDTAIVVTCPRCKACSNFFRATNPSIDSCGFESYSFQCEGCASSLEGIIDPSDDELLVSLIEPAIGVSTLSLRERVKGQEQCFDRETLGDMPAKHPMKNQRSMFMFGMQCVRCNHEIIAPSKTELLDEKVIRHIWHCPSCQAWFESFPRFPANAKSVKDVTMSVDVFPPLNGT